MVVILLLTPSTNQNGCDENDERCKRNSLLTTTTTTTKTTTNVLIGKANECQDKHNENFSQYRNTNDYHQDNRKLPNILNYDRFTPSINRYNKTSIFQTSDKPSLNYLCKPELSKSSSLYKKFSNSKQQPYNSSQEKFKYPKRKLSPPRDHLPNSKPIINDSINRIYNKSDIDQQFCNRSNNRKLHNVTFDFDHLPNFVPKPPRQKDYQRQKFDYKLTSNNFNNNSNNNNNNNNRDKTHFNQSKPKEYVRHVTRINFYDSESSQIDFNNGDENEAKPITKEEEWVTKKKTELTTTRQIETRVKRNVMLEDGKVVEDSGPMVSTNTTEDTDKKESETTERIDFESPDGKITLKQIENTPLEPAQSTGVVQKPQRKKWSKVDPGSIVLKTDEVDDDGLVLVPREEDGLVREIDEKHVISHEETDERLEVEDIQHLGDFSDEIYVKAVNSGAENLEEILYSPENQQQLIPLGPKIIHESTKTHRVVDTEDINQKSLAKTDGTLITEKKKTTEHEEFFDKDSPDNENNSTGNCDEIKTFESSQRFFKQRDEQNVEYVADGKIIGKEMRYAAETEQMERDGPHEGPNDWDSLSDRIRKTRRNPKTVLQHHREAALLADRKDALTKRPLNFDREEETRKGETMKWLESHFGSESTASSDSRDGDHDSDLIEPSKKTFFNVTIKSNLTPPSGTVQNGFDSYQPIIGGAITNGKQQNGLYSYSSKVASPEKVIPVQNGKTKYFQGISNWSDRKESNPKHFASKAFKDELQGTIAKNNLRHVSREDLRFLKSLKSEDSLKRDNIIEHNKYQYGPRSDLKYYRKNSKEDSDDSKNIRSQREDLSYLSESKKDLKYRRNSNDDRNPHLIKTNSRLKREDSGYVKDSREDVRSSILRDMEDERDTSNYRQVMMQRDDSAYISSSNFTDNRTTKIPQLRTPDSGIRSPSPDPYDPNLSGNFQTPRPAVPIRKKVIEKKLKQAKSLFSPSHYRNYESRQHTEPPPDYSPPPRSRSISPTIHLHPEVTHQLSGGNESVNDQIISNGVSIQRQRSRFEPESPVFNKNNLSHNSNASSLRPTVSTQTSPQPKQSTKVGQVIGNSFKKLVGKIRSASAERKLKMKSKSKSRERSPSPSSRNKSLPNESTYQQYNVIDSHIGETLNDTVGNNYGNNGHYNKNIQKNSHTQLQQRNSINREPSFASSSAATGLKELRLPITSGVTNSERILIDSYEKNLPDSYDVDGLSSPKQRYYLGEDPYGNSIFGKENKYNKNNKESRLESVGFQNLNTRKAVSEIRNEDEIREHYGLRPISSSTLGRYQKNSQRHLGSTPNLDCDSRTAQTLPRKLEHRPTHHSSTINVSIVNQFKPAQNTGPAKPARTYKSLNRSKSFNVHGMNGTNDPSPIYLEKLTKNNYGGNMYKSNPHLNETGPQLKSPSIVSLISRSQKDLSRLHFNNDETDRKYSNYLSNRQHLSKPNGYSDGSKGNKKDIFSKVSYDHSAPEHQELIHTVIHGNNRLLKYSDGRNKSVTPLGSKSSVEMMKDTASILRRGSTSTEEFYDNSRFGKNDNINLKQTNSSNVIHRNIPNRDGRNFQLVESNENERIMSSRYRNDPSSSLKYNKENYKNSNSSGGTTIIEVKGGKLRK